MALFSASIPVEAQQPPVHRVGVVVPGSTHAPALSGLRDGLKELGFDEGKQFVFHVHDVQGDMKAVAAAASDLERQRVDLIVSITTSVTINVKRATSTVPIVFYAGADPVATGLVESYRKPGGRLTGIHGQVSELAAKRLELLKDMVPNLRRVVVFYRPDNAAAQQSLITARHAAGQLKLELIERPVAYVDALRQSLSALAPGNADALVYLADAMVTSQTELVIERARALRLPTMVGNRGGVAQGALAAYGENYYSIGKLAARHVHKILQGGKPGDLAIEQVNKLHFAVNLGTAKALGLAIPQFVLARADEVIQ